MNLKNILITLSIVAAVLVAITFYVVFYSGGGTYVVSSTLGGNSEIFGAGNASATVATSTASSTIAFASSSITGTSGSSTIGSPSSTQIAAAPITWTQGNDTLSVTGASLSGSQLTLNVQVGMGSATECVPLNMRMIADEQGDLSPPITQQFTFPDTGTCSGTAGETYSAQPVIFTLASPATFPVILTTGGTANILFEVVQNPDGSLTAQLPPSAD